MEAVGEFFGVGAGGDGDGAGDGGAAGSRVDANPLAVTAAGAVVGKSLAGGIEAEAEAIIEEEEGKEEGGGASEESWSGAAKELALLNAKLKAATVTLGKGEDR